MTWTSNCNFMYIFCHENYLCTIFCRKYNQRTLFCCKNDSSTLVLLQKQFTHTFLLQKRFTHFFCHKNYLCPLFLSQKQFMHFVWKVFARWSLSTGKFWQLGLWSPDRNQNEQRGSHSNNFKVGKHEAKTLPTGYLLLPPQPALVWNYLKGAHAAHFDFYQELLFGTPCIREVIKMKLVFFRT